MILNETAPLALYTVYAVYTAGVLLVSVPVPVSVEKARGGAAHFGCPRFEILEMDFCPRRFRDAAVREIAR